MPSAKYAFALSPLRFSKGSTAMLFLGMDGPATVMTDVDRRRKITEVTAKTRIDRDRATITADLGQLVGLIGRTTADFCFHLLPRLSFSGKVGFPRPSL